MKILKTCAVVSLGVGGCVLFNQAGADPTRGALQNDPALCAYGYNPNCGTQSMGAHAPPVHYEPTIDETCQTQSDGGRVCQYRYIDTGLRFMTQVYDAQG